MTGSFTNISMICGKKIAKRVSAFRENKELVSDFRENKCIFAAEKRKPIAGMHRSKGS